MILIAVPDCFESPPLKSISGHKAVYKIRFSTARLDQDTIVSQDMMFTTAVQIEYRPRTPFKLTGLPDGKPIYVKLRFE